MFLEVSTLPIFHIRTIGLPKEFVLQILQALSNNLIITIHGIKDTLLQKGLVRFSEIHCGNIQMGENIVVPPNTLLIISDKNNNKYSQDGIK